MTPTLQQLLGRHYKWLYIIQYSVKNSLASIGMNLMYLIAGAMEMATYIYLYYINKSLDFQTIMTQFLIVRLYSSLVMNRWYYFTADLIYSSGMTRFLLMPTNYFGHQFCLSLGGRLVRNSLALVSNVTVWLAVCLLIQKINFGRNILTLLIFVPFGFLLNFAITLTVGHLAFFIKDKRDYGSFSEIYYIVFGVLSGVIIPLSLIPFGWVQNTPFAYVSYQPLNFYYNPTWLTFANILAWTIFWLIITAILSRLIFKAGLKKNEAVGL
jgi:ABC-type uncharacterized transport system permease subunit